MKVAPCISRLRLFTRTRTRSAMPSGSSGASMVARDMMGRMASKVSTTRRRGCARWYSASSSSHSAPPASARLRPYPALLRSPSPTGRPRALRALPGPRGRRACPLTCRLGRSHWRSARTLACPALARVGTEQPRALAPRLGTTGSCLLLGSCTLQRRCPLHGGTF